MKNGLFVQEDAFNLDVGQQDEMRRVFFVYCIGIHRDDHDRFLCFVTGLDKRVERR